MLLFHRQPFSSIWSWAVAAHSMICSCQPLSQIHQVFRNQPHSYRPDPCDVGVEGHADHSGLIIVQGAYDGLDDFVRMKLGSEEVKKSGSGEVDVGEERCRNEGREQERGPYAWTLMSVVQLES